MNISSKQKILLIVLFAILFGGWELFREKHYVTDSDFILNDNILSPDGKLRIINYQYDHGALGESRGWSAVVPADEYKSLNLAQYYLPDCYVAKEWTADNQAILLWDEDCSVPDNLKTDDTFNGLKIQVVPEKEYWHGNGMKLGKPELP